MDHYSLEVSVGNLFIEKVPERTARKFDAPTDVRAIFEKSFSEQHRVDLLAHIAWGLRNRLLFIRPARER